MSALQHSDIYSSFHEDLEKLKALFPDLQHVTSLHLSAFPPKYARSLKTQTSLFLDLKTHHLLCQIPQEKKNAFQKIIEDLQRAECLIAGWLFSVVQALRILYSPHAQPFPKASTPIHAALYLVILNSLVSVPCQHSIPAFEGIGPTRPICISGNAIKNKVLF